MANNDQAFIPKPHFFRGATMFKKSNSHIGYKDLLTYVALRSFNNIRYSSCFPALSTVADLAGTSKDFIRESIARLEADGYINVFRSGKLRVGNRYTFPKFQQFDRIPYELLECDDLTLYSKSMLLCLREFALTPVDLDLSIKEIASCIGETYKVVHRQISNLLDLGYVVKRNSKWYKLEKIDWLFGLRTQVPQFDKSEFILK